MAIQGMNMGVPVEAPEEGAFRAPARRVSATDAAARTTAIFEKALADLTGRLERVEGENVGLRREAAEKDARLEALLQTTNAALQAQAGTITALTAELATKASYDEVSGVRARLAALEGKWEGHTHSIRLPGKYWAGDSRSTGPLSSGPQVPSHY